MKILAIAALLGAGSRPLHLPDVTISSGEVSVTASTALAGAIASVRYQGKTGSTRTSP